MPHPQNVAKEEHTRPLKTFLTSQMPAMIDFLWSISDPIPDLPPIPIATGKAGDNTSVSQHVRKKLSTMPPLLHESVPDLPHSIDPFQHMAAMASTIVHNAPESGRPVAYAQPVSRDNAGRAILDEPACFEDLEAACFEIQTETLKCIEKVKSPSGKGGRRRSRSASRSIPATFRGGRGESAGTMGHTGDSQMRRSSSSRRPESRRDTLRSQEEALLGTSPPSNEVNLRSPMHHDATRSPTISIPQRNYRTAENRSPVSPISPAMVFSHRPRSSSVSSGSDFAGVILTEAATVPCTLQIQERTRHSSVEPASSTDSLSLRPQPAVSGGSPSQESSTHSPVPQEGFSAQSGLDGSMSSSAHFTSGPVSPSTAEESDRPRRIIRRVNSNPAVYSLGFPSPGDETTPRRTKGNFFKFKGLLGKNR